jgi:SAM-dependent methyltransferase
MAVTAEAVPAPPGRAYGEVRVMNARGAAADSERAHFILQSWVDVAQRSSALPYIESGANLFLRLLYGQHGASLAPKRVLLLGLGAGALPTTLKRLCGQRPALRGCAGLSVTAVDASADALAITRAFVLRDDGHTLRFMHDTAEHYLVSAARRGAWPAFLARRLLPGGGGRYDLVINDAFAGARGVARDVAALADAAAALRPVTGEYCVNALSTGADEGARARTEDAMRTVFGADAVRVEAEDASNAWLCAIAPPALTQRA